MLQILHQKYPPPDNGKNGLLLALFFGVFIGGFLWFFRPFNLNLSNYSDGQILFFGVITTITVLFFQLGLSRLFPGLFAEKRWTVIHQILFYLLVLFVIATLNGLYINYLDNLPFNWGNYRWITVRTFVLGVIPICFLVLFDFNQRLKKHIADAKQLKPFFSEAPQSAPDKLFTISTHLKDNSFTIQEGDFLFAQSNGNYVFVFTRQQPKAIYRISLNALEAQLNSSYCKRCHRSYLVNLKMVKKIEGNAQGLSLWLQGLEEPVPVSRTYIQPVKKALSDLEV